LCGYCQDLRPRLKSEAGKTLYCFDSTQASTIARELLLNVAYQDKIKSLEATERNLEAEIDARELAYLEQYKELKASEAIIAGRQAQIQHLENSLKASRLAYRKSRKGVFFYKLATVALGCTTVYLLIKK
jgi:superfamily I DNA/RNA helicase